MTEIEYEEVTIQVPKQVMEFLKSVEAIIEMTAKEWIERSTVDNVRAGIDSEEFLQTPEQMANQFKLNPIFKELTGTMIII